MPNSFKALSHFKWGQSFNERVSCLLVCLDVLYANRLTLQHFLYGTKVYLVWAQNMSKLSGATFSGLPLWLPDCPP